MTDVRENISVDELLNSITDSDYIHILSVQGGKMTVQTKDSINLDRIKDRLRERAFFYKDRKEGGFPRSVSFANERVQTSNRNTDTFVAKEVPAHIRALDELINGLSPLFAAVLTLEYNDNRPQKTKAHVLGIAREVYSQRLSFLHLQLDFALFGNHQTDAEVKAGDYRLALRLRGLP